MPSLICRCCDQAIEPCPAYLTDLRATCMPRIGDLQAPADEVVAAVTWLRERLGIWPTMTDSAINTVLNELDRLRAKCGELPDE